MLSYFNYTAAYATLLSGLTTERHRELHSAAVAHAACQLHVCDPTATDLRCGGVSWGDDELALVYESWWKTRRSVIHTIAPSRPQDGMQVPLLSSFGTQICLQQPRTACRCHCCLQSVPRSGCSWCCCLPACDARKSNAVSVMNVTVVGCRTAWLLIIESRRMSVQGGTLCDTAGAVRPQL